MAGFRCIVVLLPAVVATFHPVVLSDEGYGARANGQAASWGYAGTQDKLWTMSTDLAMSFFAGEVFT